MLFKCHWNALEIVKSSTNQFSLDDDDGSVSNKRQTIVWTTGGPRFF